MNDEIKKYLLEQCREWMLPEELKALRRINLTDYGKESTKKIALIEMKMEKLYGFKDEKTNKLLTLGKTELEGVIANRILKDNKSILNKCSKCAKLARTPKAKQCIHCGYKWFNENK
jgi:hypothetical protein